MFMVLVHATVAAYPVVVCSAHHIDKISASVMSTASAPTVDGVLGLQCASRILDTPLKRGISGLVAEYIVAIDVTRVRFPADAVSS